MDIMRVVRLGLGTCRCGCLRNVRTLSSQKDPLDLSFNDPIAAYKNKTTAELVRGYLVYQICSINFIVENNEKILKAMQKVTGKTIFNTIMKASFYGQFVAGEDPVSIRPVVDRLAQFGVKSILDYSVEEDLTAAKPKTKSNARQIFEENERACDKNMAAFLMSIEATHKVTNSTGFMAIKVTGLGRPQVLQSVNEVMMRARDSMKKVDGKVLDGFKQYFGDSKNPHIQEFLTKIAKDSKAVVHLYPWYDIADEAMNVSKTFRVPDPKTGKMRRLISLISKEEQEMLQNLLKRLDKVLLKADKLNVRVMIDAEQTYFQAAISLLTRLMQKKYNKNRFLVFNTYQAYLKNTYNEVVADLDLARRHGYFWSAKCVRGAYMEQERARAKEMGYEDPICDNFDATSASYHKCLKYILSKGVGDMKGRVAIMVASHNEDTVRIAIKHMKEMGIKREDKVLCFGQLLGMCDHVTFPLGQAGYSAYKYVPYGPVQEVLPYLSRRANENRGILAKVKKEKGLLLKEIIRRARSGQLLFKPTGNYKPI